MFVVTGVANSVNIIDGFNGLSSMCAMLILGAVAYVAFQVDDWSVMWLALAGIGALAGFFVWNYPAGLVFLGDGGAYFVGFYVAEVAILLLHRNPQVSPMFPLLACIYPVFETLFSMYRRRVLQDRSPGVPDGIHLHSLIYRRVVRWAAGASQGEVADAAQFDDLAVPLAVVHVCRRAGHAVLGQHRRAGVVHPAVQHGLHDAVLAHRAFPGAALAVCALATCP